MLIPVMSLSQLAFNRAGNIKAIVVARITAMTERPLEITVSISRISLAFVDFKDGAAMNKLEQ
jgi:hypothetical protein